MLVTQPSPDPSSSATEPSARSVDRRRNRRFALALPGRCMASNKQEFPCRTIDISMSGIAVAAAADMTVGDRIVAYFDEIGGVDGTVARTFDGGFAFALTMSKHKREKLAAQVTWLVNAHELTGIEGRRHERIPVRQTTNLVLADGTIHQVRCIDVSVSGASVMTRLRPNIGTAVTLGRLTGKIVRHHPEGVAVQFVTVQSRDSLDRNFG
jgi:hypothetical protein